MKNICSLIFYGAAGLVSFCQQPSSSNYNLSSFNLTKTEINQELKQLIPADFHDHPDFGILPSNAPCASCYELVHLRTDSTRMFVEKGSEGTKFLSQAAYGAIHYTDGSGYLRPYDHHLQPTASTGIFTAEHQDFPIVFDLNNKESGFNLPDGSNIRFNKNLRLTYHPESGPPIDQGLADWSNYTIGEDGMKIFNAWPGIDMELKVSQGQIKTDYIVNSPLLYSGGHLVITDEFTGPSSFHLQIQETFEIVPGTGAHIGTASFLNPDGYGAIIEMAYGYDQSGLKNHVQRLGYKTNDHELELWIPLDWLNDSNLVYPVIIDPAVTSSATYTAGIMRFRHNGSYCGGPNADCGYTLNVPRPANATLTGATYSLVQETLAGSCFFVCYMNEAGWYFSTSCGVNGYWGCSASSPGTCTATNLDISNLVTCLPPACSGTIPFTIYNSYCYCTVGANCGTSCQRINNNTWIVTVSGSTVETLGNTATGNGSTTINDADCIGTSVLDPTTANGVPGYTYLWNTGATSPTITVNNLPSIYTCTVTDACGVSVIATFNIGCPLNSNTISLSGSSESKFIRLYWQAIGSNFVSYRIERSQNGLDFAQISSIESNSENGNTFKDYNPRNGINYYRIIGINEYGEETTSEMISIEFEIERLRIIPNPSNGNFSIELPPSEAESAELKITDTYGKIIYLETVALESSTNFITVDLTGNQPGTYFVELNLNGLVQSSRLVISY